MNGLEMAESEFQRKCYVFVSNNAILNLGPFIEPLIADGELWDDIENLYQVVCDGCGEVCSDKDEGDYSECCDERCSNEPQEIFEWWAISRNLFNALNDIGAPVLNYNGYYIWGRTTTGQAISMDWEIREIVKDRINKYGAA